MQKGILAMAVVVSAFLLVVGSLFFQQDSSQQSPEPGAMADTTLDEELQALIEEKRKEGLEPNRLITEKSPYLLQHAFNPVDWYPWGEEAFERARAEDKPIFLSVGYSTCYWCHVMERTVFEVDSLAELMDRDYISIKVDREERPDVDRVYMNALQSMTGGGGWPMSLFLTPDLKPFFGATYIPPERDQGRPGFGDVLRGIQDTWMNQRPTVLEQAERMRQHLEQISVPDIEPEVVGEEVLETAFTWYRDNYDATYGGFGQAPKFPRPVSFDFLLDYHERTGNEEALSMTLWTLRAMARGGMYDHLGEGFHRYSTDAKWHVPHFEKMLYDQAQLVNSYLRAFEITGDSLYADVARNTLAYVDRMMLHDEGGFYSAEDAESFSLGPMGQEAKKEGAFYIWKKSEIEGLLEPPAVEVFISVYGVREEGNAEFDPHQEFVGENILYLAHTPEEAAEQFGSDVSEIEALLEESERILFEERETRPHPHHDDKILLSWNGLMISAYASAYRVLGDEHYREVAERSVEFLYNRLFDEETGRFKRRFRNGEARYDAHLEDYAYLAHGLIDLYKATDDDQYLEKVTGVTETMLERFYDAEHGGFFSTDRDDPSILVPSKEYYDGAGPAGNSIAILDLVRLYEITGNASYREKAAQSLAYYGSILKQGPTSPMMLRAHMRLVGD